MWRFANVTGCQLLLFDSSFVRLEIRHNLLLSFTALSVLTWRRSRKMFDLIIFLYSPADGVDEFIDQIDKVVSSLLDKPERHTHTIRFLANMQMDICPLKPYLQSI